MNSNQPYNVIRGLIALITSNILGIVFGFITITIAARLIIPSTFGVYSLIVAIINILEVIGNFGIRLSSAKFVASALEKSEKERIVNNILTFRLASIVFACAIAVLAKPLVLKVYPSAILSDLYFYVPLLFSVQIFEETLAYLMQGYQLYRKMAWVQFISSMTGALFVVIFLLVFHLGIHGFFWALIFSLVIAIFIRLLWLPGRKKFAFDFKLIKEILTFGLPLQGNDALSLIFEKADVLILGALMGSSSIAYLDMARRLPNYVQSLYQSLQSVYFPYMSEMFSKKDQNQAVVALNHFLRLTSFFSMACALIFTLFQKEVVLLIFSSAYSASVPAAGILMFATGIGMISTILDTALISAGKPAYLLIINVVTAIANVGTNFALIPLWGVVGGAFARLFANSASAPVSGGCLWHEKVHFDLKATLLPILFAGLGVGAFTLLHFNSYIDRSLIILLFLAACFGFSLIRWNDVTTLMDALKHKQTEAVVE